MRIRKKKKQHKSTRTTEGGVTRIPITDKIRAILNEADELFRKKFGRDPVPDDPIFFDSRKDETMPMDEEYVTPVMSEAMRKVGIDEDLIYAWEKTGRLVTENSKLTKEEREEWNAALREYHERQEKDGH